ncbi:MAG TPA: LCP family protein [Pseudonocardiaceae bacterium]|jgi:LCP family protein required for cell wall assembly|nr:LCP family protein [Pseudonocardiaceae bacterium]
MTDVDRVSGDLVGVDELLESTEDEGEARRHRRWGRIAVQVSLGLLALLVFGVAGLLWQVTDSVTGSVHTVRVAALPPAPADPSGAPMTVLLLGSDLRAGADVNDGSGVTGQRADAIMLIRLSADRSRIDVLSIPRDSWVAIPGHGVAKINASLGGGPSLVVQTVHALTGIQIDHVVVMDFNGVRDITTALGGVTIVNEKAMTDPRNGSHFDAGPITLSGDRALTYVRQRYGLPGGDLDRIGHEQQLVSAISHKLAQSNLVASPLLAEHVVRIVADNMTVDAGLTPTLMTQLLVDIVSTPSQGVHFYTAPTASFGRSSDGQDYINLDMTKLAAACQALRDDKPVPLRGTHFNVP